MKLEFLEKERCFDDISYAYSIKSKYNNYFLTITFCGGINEDGEQDLYSSCHADIELIEMKKHNHELLSEVFDLLKNDIDVKYDSPFLTINSNDDREIITTRNESSFDDSMEDFNKFLMAVTAILLKHEMMDDKELEDDELLKLI